MKECREDEVRACREDEVKGCREDEVREGGQFRRWGSAHSAHSEPLLVLRRPTTDGDDDEEDEVRWVCPGR